MELKKPTMESLVGLFNGIYKNKTILLTGHTGFKGSWLSYWLNKMGANVIGFSNKIPSTPSHFEILGKEIYSDFVFGNINDSDAIERTFEKNKIDLVFHLAAQSLVRYSYSEPIETFETNVLGTARVIEHARKSKFVKGVVAITSDKCYENFEDDKAYNEEDRLGGHDPYSASKGAAEIVINSLRRSFLNIDKNKNFKNFILASGRAGNVIGGGDWSNDRLIPDLVKNAAVGIKTKIRNPNSTRPWQHVLEPLTGYLILGQKILSGDNTASGAFNFGPSNNETLTVDEIIKQGSKFWSDIKVESENNEYEMHEAKLLRLDCKKANYILNWQPVWNSSKAIEKTIEWYKNYYVNKIINTENDLYEYIEKARKINYTWSL